MPNWIFPNYVILQKHNIWSCIVSAYISNNFKNKNKVWGISFPSFQDFQENRDME